MIGLVGAAAILICFVLNLTGKMNSSSLVYLYSNLFGGLLVAVNSYWFSAYPALLINLVWSVAATFGLVRLHFKKTGKKAVE